MVSDSERRHFSRVRFHSSCVISQGDQQWECLLLDVSIKGLLVAKPEGFDADADAKLEASIALSDSALIRMDVAIARSESNRLGLVCTNIDVESIGHLRRLVELNLGVPDAAERELHELLAHHEEHS